jgi:hypothetical protein
MTATLVKYDEMCRAISEACAVDEVADIRDTALAMEMYLRQQRNIDAERQACAIRLRAERRLGELTKELQRAQGQRSDLGTSLHDETKSATLQQQLDGYGITKTQAYRWGQLADVPEEQFEAALADPDRKPTTAGIIRESRPPDPAVVPVAANALWLWGRLCDFERDRLLQADPADVLLTMTDAMLDDVHRLAPAVAAWLKRIGEPDA